jgi:hypothetical protein
MSNLLDQRTHNPRRALPVDLDQHHEPRLALDERGDVGVVGARDEVPLRRGGPITPEVSSSPGAGGYTDRRRLFRRMRST